MDARVGGVGGLQRKWAHDGGGELHGKWVVLREE